MTKTLFILNDAPYGTERSYNALRLAGSPARGMADAELAEGARRGTLSQLTDWTMWADKTLVF